MSEETGNQEGLSRRGKRGLGNPHGIRGVRKWEPLKWKVEHETVVLLHVSGKSNKYIAAMMEKSELWVSLVINSRKAGEIIQGIKDNLPKKDLAERYKYILEKSSERVVEFLDDDRFALANPDKMADRALRAIEMIDGRFKKADGGGNVTNNNTLVLATESTVNRLLTAMERSNQVTELHRIKTVEEPV